MDGSLAHPPLYGADDTALPELDLSGAGVRINPETAERRRIAAALDLKTGAFSDGRSLVAEALTDCDSANTTLSRLASHIRAAMLGSDETADREIGRIVREAVLCYARAALG
ncbi:hypothetical protein D0B54_18465 [Solimonas sp. K1W22B-7]|nr:hypothetical protein D0B54_18465 [Solimonas sp. K1W22B-7]